VPEDLGETRRALREAQAQSEVARRRAEQLESEAVRADAEATRSASEAAALAARIQQLESDIAASEQRLRLTERQRAALRQRLARQQWPLVRLTAALQRLSRRPPMLSLLRPGSVVDAVHSRGLLESILPEVRRRTAGLRDEIARAAALERQAQATRAQLQAQNRTLTQRRLALTALETRQRMAARSASGSADREAERALALAEQARDLGSLVVRLEQASQVRARLAQLPGPIIRPARPDLAAAPATTSAALPAAMPDASLPQLMMPANGRIVTGFGGQSRGVSIATRAGAQVVAPAAGRVAFADSYSGYGQIAIIEHGNGWMSVTTGLASLDVRVGDKVSAGAPLGAMGPGRPVLGFELRKDGQPTNPLDRLPTR
jgi:septal ring factor EnvC (AmiA/AmiB activator)